MKFEYKSTNFISNPKENDKRIKIYDKNKNLKYSIEPEFDYTYIINNCLFVKIVNKNDIKLSFENKNDAILALNKLLKIKEFFLKIITISGSNTYSISNLNMASLTTNENFQLSCNIPVKDDPTSMIRVYINGVDVNIGNPLFDNSSYCFFAPYSGLTQGQSILMSRKKGEEQKGDYLYWIGSSWTFGDKSGDGAGFELDTNDLIDFVYLTSTNNIKITTNIYSLMNINMNTTNTLNNGDIACLEPIIDDPESNVRILINEEEVIVGNPLTNINSVCFFAPGNNYTSSIFALFNAREIGQEQKGDYLYWIGSEWILNNEIIINGAGFELLDTYSIDFIYTTKTN